MNICNYFSLKTNVKICNFNILDFFFFFFHHKHMQLSCESALHLRYWPGGGRDLFPSSVFGFELLCARLSLPRGLTCSLGLQDVQWTVRLVVVRTSWLGHPRKSKKKIVNRHIEMLDTMVFFHERNIRIV